MRSAPGCGRERLLAAPEHVHQHQIDRTQASARSAARRSPERAWTAANAEKHSTLAP